MRDLFALLFFICAVLLGQWLMTDAWDGIVYIYVGEDRSPATVKNLSDYYPVSNRHLRKPIREQLFGSVAFVEREHEIGIQVGNVLMPDDFGRRRFACSAQNRLGIFDRIELSFVGVGVSDNGQIPKMTIDSACGAEEDLSVTSPIWVPMSDIYQSEPKTQELKFPEIGQTAVHFENLASAWPQKWALVKVRLYQSGGGAPVLWLEPKRPSSSTLSFDWHSAK